MNEQENNENQETVKEENEQIDTSKTSTEETAQKKKNLFKTVTGFVASKTLTGLKTAGNTIVTGAKKVNDSYHSFTSEQELKRKKREAFENDCQTYLILGKTDKRGASYLIQAVRFREKSELFFMHDEETLAEVNSNIHLKNTSDDSEIKILEVEKDKTSYYTITVDDTQYKIAGVIASYCLSSFNTPTISNYTTVKQEITVTGDHNQISQNSNLDQDLKNIQAEIQNSKIKFYQKGKKDEALQLFGNFKDCVVNQQKNESLFKKFLKVLGELGLTVAIEAAKILIARIP